MNVDDFDYALPEEAIAQEPVEPRDAARLLVLRRAADACEHRRVRDLPQLLEPMDLLVVNDTRVRRARLIGRRETGGVVELLLLERLPDGAWRALARPASKLRAGEELEVEGGALRARCLRRPVGPDGELAPEWLLELAVADPSASLDAALERHGRMPLPPYIRRPRGPDLRREADALAYQTVFARELGAVAAPTAGLHFTPGLLAALEARGVETARVTLHVGEGTFRPVEVERVEEHRMHAERFEVPQGTADAVARCRARGGRVIAVGTTSTRALESCAASDGALQAGRGETRLFLTPGASFRVVDGLLTNFHLPRSTLLMLVAAFAGRERVLRLYDDAIRRGYRIASYGDATLFL